MFLWNQTETIWTKKGGKCLQVQKNRVICPRTGMGSGGIIQLPTKLLNYSNILHLQIKGIKGPLCSMDAKPCYDRTLHSAAPIALKVKISQNNPLFLWDRPVVKTCSWHYMRNQRMHMRVPCGWYQLMCFAKIIWSRPFNEFQEMSYKYCPIIWQITLGVATATATAEKWVKQ